VAVTVLNAPCDEETIEAQRSRGAGPSAPLNCNATMTKLCPLMDRIQRLRLPVLDPRACRLRPPSPRPPVRPRDRRLFRAPDRRPRHGCQGRPERCRVGDLRLRGGAIGRWQRVIRGAEDVGTFFPTQYTLSPPQSLLQACRAAAPRPDPLPSPQSLR